MRPPPREEGRIISHRLYHRQIYALQANLAETEQLCNAVAYIIGLKPPMTESRPGSGRRLWHLHGLNQNMAPDAHVG